MNKTDPVTDAARYALEAVPDSLIVAFALAALALATFAFTRHG